MRAFPRDLCFGPRGLRHSTGGIAVLALAAGLGITTVEFALVWQAIGKTLDRADGRLFFTVVVWWRMCGSEP